MTEETDAELLVRLRETGDHLPMELRKAILAADRDVIVPGLLEIMDDEELLADDPEKTSPPVYAAMLLGLLEAEEAIEPLTKIIAREGASTAFGATCGTALQHYEGEKSLDAVVEAYQSATSDIERKALAGALSGFGRHSDDSRVLEILMEELEKSRDPGEMAINIMKASRYQHPKTAWRLRSWFADADIDPDTVVGRFAIRAFAQAMEARDIDLTERERRLVEAAEDV